MLIVFVILAGGFLIGLCNILIEKYSRALIHNNNSDSDNDMTMIGLAGNNAEDTDNNKHMVIDTATNTDTAVDGNTKVDSDGNEERVVDEVVTHNQFFSSSAHTTTSNTTTISSLSLSLLLPVNVNVNVNVSNIHNHYSSSSSSNSKQQQINNYRNGTGLMLNMHPVHHAGTTFCTVIGRNGINGDTAPNYACLIDQENRMPGYNTTKFVVDIKPPWTIDELTTNLEKVRSYFHMLSWEFNGIEDIDTQLRPLAAPQLWEHPFLLSIVITRHPLSRLLAGNMLTKRKFPGYNRGRLSHEGWWNYAALSQNKNVDNFFLRILSNTNRQIRSTHNYTKGTERIGTYKRKENHKAEKEMAVAKQNEVLIPKSVDAMMQKYPSNIHEDDYKRALTMLNRFTIVLDIECLNQGMIELSKLLQLNTTRITQLINGTDTDTDSMGRTNSTTSSSSTTTKKKKREKQLLTVKERIEYDDVYAYLQEKNYWDIKLYEYSKTISLVRC